MAMEIRGLHRRFGAVEVLRGIDLDIGDGELIALLGASGSGKTTLLRILAGLDWPDAGSVRLGGEDWLAIETQRRRVGFVFQHYALFQHMTIAANVAFGLDVRPRGERPAPAEIARRVEALLALVQLDGLGGRYPAQLSGGQRQRVALARALAIEPRILLLDEPFGALDARVRKDLRRWLRDLHERVGTTTVFVTHDQEEAFELADRVVLIRDGRIEQAGAPEEIYEHPATPFVSRFLGGVNELKAEIRGGRAVLPGADTAALAPLALPDGPRSLFVRPQEIEIAPAADAEARVRSVVSSGPHFRLEVDLPGAARPVEVEIGRAAMAGRRFRRGDAVRLQIKHARVFAPEQPAL